MTDPVGQLGPQSANTPFNSTASLIKQMLGRISTSTLVQIKKVYPAGPAEMGGNVGWVDVLPLVNQTDGANTVQKHATIFQLPYFRAQGGSRAVVLDPVVGDIGLAVICSRDISSVKKTKKQSNPGSRRRFSLSDGVYCMSLLGGKPTSRVEFKDDGSVFVTPDDGTTSYKVEGGKITLTAATIVLASGDIRLGGEGASRAVSASGTVTSDGASDVSNFLTSVKGL